VRSFSLLAFCILFTLAALAVGLADRLLRRRGQAFLRSYFMHLAFWNVHALLMFIQFILGVAFLPRESWTPLMVVLGPAVALSAGISLLFLIRFAGQATGRALPKLFPFLYFGLWTGLVLAFALAAGASPAGPARPFLAAYSIGFAVLKVGTVLAATGILFAGARRAGPAPVRTALRAVAWTYLAGFLLHQISVSSPLLDRADGVRDYVIVLVQVGFQFAVLGALGRYAKRRAAESSRDAPPGAAGRLDGLGISPREAEIVGLVLRGMSNDEIGGALFISLDTVKKHLTSIYRKCGVRNRLQLSLWIRDKDGRPEAQSSSTRS
jgi:DNA-binding CsgD family transcriptional regulator